MYLVCPTTWKQPSYTQHLVRRLTRSRHSKKLFNDDDTIEVAKGRAMQEREWWVQRACGRATGILQGVLYILTTGPTSEKCAPTLSLWSVSSKSLFSISFLVFIGKFLNLPVPLSSCGSQRQWCYPLVVVGMWVIPMRLLPEQCLARGTRSLLAQLLLPVHPPVCCPRISVKISLQNTMRWPGLDPRVGKRH